MVDQSSSMLEGSELVAKNQSSRLISGKREDCAEGNFVASRRFYIFIGL